MTFAEFWPLYLAGLWLMLRQALPILPFAAVVAMYGTRALMKTLRE